MFSSTFYYRYMERSEVWRAVYTNPGGDKLELLIDSSGISWLLTAKEYPEKGSLRDILLKAVARMRVNLDGKSVLEGKWQVCDNFHIAHRYFVKNIFSCGYLQKVK